MNKLVLWLTFGAMFFTYPYVFNKIIPIPSEIIVVILMLGLLAFILLNRRFIKSLPHLYTICIGIQIFFWLFYCAFHSDSSYLTRIIYILFIYVVITSLHNFSSVKNFITINNKIITVQAVLGLVAFLLVLIGLLHPLFEFQNVDGRTAYCFGLTCSNVYVGNFIRAAGFFDEPGALAFWGVYALILNQLYIKNSRVEILLIIGLLSTLSMAYFIQVALYFLLFKFNWRLNFKSLIVIAVIGVSIYGIYSLGEDNGLYKMTIGRFVATDYGELETNRDEPMEKAKKYFLLKPALGHGATKLEENGVYYMDNPYETLATDGILGTIIIYLPLIFLVIRNRHHREVLYGIFIIIVGYLQRPFHMVVLHYLMLYSLLYLGLCEKGNLSHVVNKKMLRA